MTPPTVSDVLQAHADRLTPHLLNRDLPDEARGAIGNAQHTIRVVSELGDLHKIKVIELPPRVEFWMPPSLFDSYITAGMAGMACYALGAFTAWVML
jgi:hypothetical protein